MPFSVIPAKAGIQSFHDIKRTWTPFLARLGGFNGVTTFYETVRA